MTPETLIGRDAERVQLAGALARAEAGRGALLLVSGEAGVGKTRLVTELAQKAEDRTCTVLSGRAVDTVAPVGNRRSSHHPSRSRSPDGRSPRTISSVPRRWTTWTSPGSPDTVGVAESR